MSTEDAVADDSTVAADVGVDDVIAWAAIGMAGLVSAVFADAGGGGGVKLVAGIFDLVAAVGGLVFVVVAAAANFDAVGDVVFAAAAIAVVVFVDVAVADELVEAMFAVAAVDDLVVDELVIVDPRGTFLGIRLPTARPEGNPSLAESADTMLRC